LCNKGAKPEKRKKERLTTRAMAFGSMLIFALLLDSLITGQKSNCGLYTVAKNLQQFFSQIYISLLPDLTEKIEKVHLKL